MDFFVELRLEDFLIVLEVDKPLFFILLNRIIKSFDRSFVLMKDFENEGRVVVFSQLVCDFRY